MPGKNGRRIIEPSDEASTTGSKSSARSGLADIINGFNNVLRNGLSGSQSSEPLLPDVPDRKERWDGHDMTAGTWMQGTS